MEPNSGRHVVVVDRSFWNNSRKIILRVVSIASVIWYPLYNPSTYYELIRGKCGRTRFEFLPKCGIIIAW